MIYLLDLNFTLVENSTTKRSPFTRQIEGEIYRTWLVQLLRNKHVVLITARPEKYKILTLESIQSKTNWSPQQAFFNDLNLPPPSIKKSIIERFLMPYLSKCVAIESNPITAKMYNAFGIPSYKIMGSTPWNTLPTR